MKIKLHVISLPLLFSSFVYGAASPNCIDLYLADLGVAIHSNNFVNMNVTRTADGGPYKRQDLIRDRDDFNIRGHSDFKIVYEPKHPDANSEGYVMYPNIDPTKEREEATAAAQVLRELARHHVCGTSLLEDQYMAYIRYDRRVSFRTPDIFSDTLRFSANGTLEVFTRRLMNGTEITARLIQ